MKIIWKKTWAATVLTALAAGLICAFLTFPENEPNSAIYVGEIILVLLLLVSGLLAIIKDP